MTTLSDLQDLLTPYYQWTMCEVYNDDEYENTGNGIAVPGGNLNLEIIGDFTSPTVCSNFGSCTAYSSVSGETPWVTNFRTKATDTNPEYFPGTNDWDVEMYVRFPDIPTTGYQIISSDDDYWEIKATFSASDVTITCTMEEEPFAGPATLTGTIPNDGCWHQIWWSYYPYDTEEANLYLDGVQQDSIGVKYDNDAFLGSWPSYMYFGMLDGIQTTVQFSHMAFYYTTGGLVASEAATHFATFEGCCDSDTEIPPLRQKQRDDSFNSPRNEVGPNAQVQSQQSSIRQSRGSNTYLYKPKKPCGCGKSKKLAV